MTLLFSEYVRCLLEQFSGFLLDLTFQEFAVNVWANFFLFYQELPQVKVVLGATFVLFRFPGPCTLIFFQILQIQDLSIGNISSTSKPELFFWSLIVMSGLLVSLFLSVGTAKSQKIVALSVSTMDSSLCSFQLLDSHYKVTDRCLLDQHQLVKLVVGIGHPEIYFPGFLFSFWVPLS